MAELKPCPFCGGKALLSHDYEGGGASCVRCGKCGLESIRFIKAFDTASDDRAVEFWNSRADDETDAPTIDAVPVRRGRWVQVIVHVEVEDGFVDRVKECCSVCHEPNGIRRTYFCPNCGAKMDGGTDDD